MPEDLYSYRVEPDAGFADRLEAELLRRLHGRVDTTVVDRQAVGRLVTAIGLEDGDQDRRPRRSGAGRRHRRRVSLGVAAAAAAVFAVGTFAVSRFPSEQNAAAEVRRAIKRQEEVDSYEATQITEYPDGRTERSTVRVDGDDAEVEATVEDPDGRTEHFSITAVGELQYTTIERKKVVSPREHDVGIQPSIAELSRALFGALGNSDVTRAGSDVIAGGMATRYEIDLNDRSRVALADPVLGFDPDRIVQLTIWVASDYPRQVEWVLDDGEHTVFTFLSIGEDVDIVAPAGDYTFEPAPDLFD